MWDKLKKKKVCVSGKFAWGVRERLSALAREHGATIARDLNAKVDLLVVPDLSGAKTVQKQASSLNAKGATIQVVDADDFSTQIAPTDEELVAVLRRGSKSLELFSAAITHYAGRPLGKQPTRIIAGESFAGLDLSGFNFEDLGFDSCDFSRTKLSATKFGPSRGCKFDHASGRLMIENAQECSFKGAKIGSSDFSDGSDLDFTGADLTKSDFNKYGFAYVKGRMTNAIFKRAKLESAEFEALTLVQPDFSGANLLKASFSNTSIEAGNFTRSSLVEATMGGSTFKNCDFSGADLRRANLVDADLSGSNFDGADLTGCNLRGAKTSSVSFAKAKGYSTAAQAQASAGPALRALDQAVAKAKRIKFAIKLATPIDGRDSISGDTSHLEYGWAVHTPVDVPRNRSSGKTTLSDELLLAARGVGDVKLRFETLEINTTKSKTAAKQLRDVFIKALCEAFAQEAPDSEKLVDQIKSERKARLKATAGARKKRAAALARGKAQREKTARKQLTKMEQKVAKAVGGKVTDIAGFLKALELRADVAKISKATKMLKAEKFQLFNDIADSHLQGVVKSQTDPDLVYACRIESDGQYACCTQNLNICGGLRGSICKHLLVLIIGLVKTGELDPSTIDGWVAKTRSTKPELNKETMGEIFIRYKGAEAGEVDWRPTETVPEDYYAL